MYQNNCKDFGIMKSNIVLKNILTAMSRLDKLERQVSVVAFPLKIRFGQR